MRKSLALLAAAGLALTLAACGHNVEQRAATGAAAGAVVGGPVGAVAGAAAGTVVADRILSPRKGSPARREGGVLPV